jgi:hypothetical protein
MTQLKNCIQFLDLKPNDYTAKIHNHKIIPSDHLENHNNNYNFTVQKSKIPQVARPRFELGSKAPKVGEPLK